MTNPFVVTSRTIARAEKSLTLTVTSGVLLKTGLKLTETDSLPDFTIAWPAALLASVTVPSKVVSPLNTAPERKVAVLLNATVIDSKNLLIASVTIASNPVGSDSDDLLSPRTSLCTITSALSPWTSSASLVVFVSIS